MVSGLAQMTLLFLFFLTGFFNLCVSPAYRSLGALRAAGRPEADARKR